MEFTRTLARFNEYDSITYYYSDITSINRNDYDLLEYYNSNRLIELFDEDEKALSKNDYDNDSRRVKHLRDIQKIFEEEYLELISTKKYFYGCSFEVYEKAYPSRYEKFKIKYPDAIEIEFIELEFNKEDPTSKLTVFLTIEQNKNKEFSLKRRREYLKNRASKLGYALEDDYDEMYPAPISYYFTKIPNEHNDLTNNITPINWIGSQIEVVELVKALIENGSIKGTQKDIINKFSKFFNIEINNLSKTINDIKNTRNNGSETLFIDKLKESLLSFINKENTR